MTRDIGSVYGKYTHGNHYYDFFTRKEQKNRLDVVKNDLKLSNISQTKLKSLTCMNVGTGREALALSQLGAEKVYHYDISKEHVSRFKKWKRNNYPKKKIESARLDLCNSILPKDKFDFIYLNGIIHHVSNVRDGLLNVAQSTKLNGIIWCYFYRSGTFKWFICQMIRELINPDDIDKFFINIANIYGKGDTSHILVSRLMDDFFAPYIHLYSLKNYENFMKNIGFEAINFINSKNRKDIDHNNLHHSSIIVFKKIRVLDKLNKFNKNLLTPNKSINQLDKTLYNNKKYNKILDLFKKIKKNKSESKYFDRIFTCILSIHRLATPQYYGEKELPPKINELELILQNTLKILK